MRGSLRSRRLEVVGTRKSGRARRRHARGEVAPSPLACLPRARPFSISPTTPKRLLRRLNAWHKQWIQTAWLETKTVKVKKLQVGTEENQNQEITKTAKSEDCEVHLHCFEQRKLL